MANVFKRVDQVDFGTVPSTVYTVPGGATAIVIGMVASNKLNQLINVTVTLAGTQLISDVEIPEGASLSILDNKIVLNAGDTVDVSADVNTAGDFLLSILEQT